MDNLAGAESLVSRASDGITFPILYTDNDSAVPRHTTSTTASTMVWQRRRYSSLTPEGASCGKISDGTKRTESQAEM